MEPDRRESPRTDILGALAGEVNVPAPVLVYDISRTGAHVECAFPLLLGSVHELRLHLGDDAVVVKARVVHCQIADIGRDLVRYTAGVEYVDLPAHVAAALDAFLECLHRARGEAPERPAPPASS